MELGFSCNCLILTQIRGINVQTLHLFLFVSDKEKQLGRKS